MMNDAERILHKRYVFRSMFYREAAREFSLLIHRIDAIKRDGRTAEVFSAEARNLWDWLEREKARRKLWKEGDTRRLPAAEPIDELVG